MSLPSFVSGLLLGSIVPAFRDPAIQLLCKQIEILLRILADHGIHTIVCKPEERLALLAIGKEMNHHIKAFFKINTWHTYRHWLLEQKAGKQPKRLGVPATADRPPKFTLEEIALVVRLAKENIFFGLGKIVGDPAAPGGILNSK